MSDIFDDTLKSAADSFFLLPGAEMVTYFPASGSARRIRAVVSRTGPAGLPSIADGSMPEFSILVKNDSSEGIASESVDTGGDKIECAKRVAERPKLLRLTGIINHDAGLMLLATS